jgi:protein-disulfide isomerase
MTTAHAPATLAVGINASDHVLGPDHAGLTVVEYGDFECPSCKAAEPAVRQLRAVHGGRLRFVWRHFPLEDAHPHALLAAEAAESAAAQGRFWEMHDLLLERSPRLARAQLESCAASLGLDMARFRADLDDEVYRQRVREHQDGGRRSHLRATPTFFVNGVVQDVSGGYGMLVDAVSRALHR